LGYEEGAMEEIRKEVEAFVGQTDCGTSRGAIEDLEYKVNRLTALTGELLQKLNDSNRVNDADVKEILDAFVWG
jgi:hypothetical protein